MERSRVIIGIHGLANKPPADEKTRWWKEAIAEGLSRNEGVADPRFAFEFVYWADLRYDAPLTKDENREPYRPYDGIGPMTGGDEAPALTAKEVLAPVYAGIDIVEEVTGITPVDDVILESRFDDLWHYHAEQSFARAVRRRLIERLEAFRDHRILLVAHSMGSVIAYDALMQLEQEDSSVKVEHLVTAAAPLGLAKVKLKFEAEHGALRVPNNVLAWTNLTDSNDIVSIMGKLETDYGPNNAGMRVADRRVVNAYLRPDATSNHHKSYGYLRTPEFSRVACGYVDPPFVPSKPQTASTCMSNAVEFKRT
ncbi:alpha/beta hydrolase [Methylobacterium sp. 77]|uniref:alpha/beta hydrolase n=1 Tax=Methylobacterium sp. 77 TaxID=1101192 RepID=UPI0003A88FB8|nr:alpha/beta hydrolase [Methylobacterium sp. 77]